MLKKIKDWIQAKISRPKSEIELLQESIRNIKNNAKLNLYNVAYSDIVITSYIKDIKAYCDFLDITTRALAAKLEPKVKDISPYIDYDVNISLWYTNDRKMYKGNTMLYNWLDTSYAFSIEFLKLNRYNDGRHYILRPYYDNILYIIKTIEGLK